jgi:hypothetical protein
MCDAGFMAQIVCPLVPGNDRARLEAGGQAGQVGHPQPVRCVGVEVAVDPVRRGGVLWVASGRSAFPALRRNAPCSPRPCASAAPRVCGQTGCPRGAALATSAVSRTRRRTRWMRRRTSSAPAAARPRPRGATGWPAGPASRNRSTAGGQGPKDELDRVLLVDEPHDHRRVGPSSWAK